MSVQPSVGKIPLPPKPPLLPKPKNIGVASNPKGLRKLTTSSSFHSVKVSVTENGTSHQLTRSKSATVSSTSVSHESSVSHGNSTANGEDHPPFNTKLSSSFYQQHEVSVESSKVVKTEDFVENVPGLATPNKSFLHPFDDHSEAVDGDRNLPISINVTLSSTPKSDFILDNEYSSLSECGWSETNSISSDSIEDGGIVKKRLSALINYFRNDKEDSKSDTFFYDDYSEDSSSKSLIQEHNVNDDNSTVSENTSCTDQLALSSDPSTLVESCESKRTKTFLIAQELMTSEEAYVDALRLIVHDFVNHVEKCGKESGAVIIQKTDLNRIINTLPQLLLLNEHLLSDLKSRIANWDNLQKIADVIAKNGPFLKLYITYMKNFEFQSHFLDECCQKYPKFSKALKDFESSKRCRKLTLKHYMLKPVQRIPQYRLLLEDYGRHLDEESPDFKDTSAALTVVHDVLHLANSSMKDCDRLSKLLEIQAALGNYEIIKPGRDFLKEGDLYKLSRKELQLRHFILLSDCLLYTTYLTSMSGLRVKYELPLSGMKLSKLHKGDPTEFSIITSTRSFTLKAQSEEEQIEWTSALHDAIIENKHKQLSFLNTKCLIKSYDSEPLKFGKEAPVWVQDKQATMCQVCTAEFTVTFRRHHCRSCGKVVCGVCSNNKAPLQYLKFDSARVCEECYDILFQEFEDSANMIEAVKSELKVSHEEAVSTLNILRYSFKKYDTNKKPKKYVPQRLKEVTANDSDSLVSGWLFKKGKRGWKRSWYVLKDQVMYAYKASQDVVAHDTIPVLGYTIDRPSEDECEEMDPSLVFRLNHPGQTPLEFAGNHKANIEKWVSVLTTEVVLK